jgi:hypothetical protein
MNTVLDENLGFSSLHVLGFHFSGIFQLRLATDVIPLTIQEDVMVGHLHMVTNQTWIG